MITQVRPSGYNNPKISTFAGRSIDTKPINVENGSKFTEIDTGRIYVFDKTNKIWIEKAGSGGSSVNIEPITIVENGVTTAPEGTAYSPITVNVPSVPEPYIKETYKNNQLVSAEIVGSVGQQIRPGLFLNCSALASVSWTEPITKIGSRAFEGCSAITSLDFSQDNVRSVGDHAFSQCRELKEITFKPNTLRTFGDNAFEYCSKLQTFSIISSPKLLGIGLECFKSCIALNTVYLMTNTDPTTMYVNVGGNAFEGCTNLTDIYVFWPKGGVANAPWGATNATIHYDYTGG